MLLVLLVLLVLLLLLLLLLLLGGSVAAPAVAAPSEHARTRESARVRAERAARAAQSVVEGLARCSRRADARARRAGAPGGTALYSRLDQPPRRRPRLSRRPRLACSEQIPGDAMPSTESPASKRAGSERSGRERAVRG